MAGIMIYVPGTPTPAAETLVELGLGELLEPGVAPLWLEPGGQTPDGERGKLVVFDDPQRPDLQTPRSIDLATQRWMVAPPSMASDDRERAGGRYWIGFVEAEPPGPDDLVRRDLCDGVHVQLNDDRHWVVPIARYLPQRLTRDSQTGEEATRPEPRHREFAERSNDLFVHFMSDAFQEEVSTTGRVVIPQGLAFAALALAKNYRVNIDVLDALGLVSEWEAFEIARVACGLPDLVKLKEHELQAAASNTTSEGYLPIDV